MAKKEIFKKEANPAQEFLPIRVSDFDKMINLGGVEKGNTILITGGAGSGKTTFCLQSAINALNNNENVLYITFEESPEKMIRHMKNNFGWDFNAYEKKGKFKIIKKDPFELNREVKGEIASMRGKKLLIKVKGVKDLIPKGFKPSRIFVDSLSALSSAFEDDKETYRIYLIKLFRDLEENKSVNLIIGETEQNPNTYSRTGVEEFLVDGVVVLYNFRQGQMRERGIEILKLRCSNHSKSLAPYTITNNGLEIHSESMIFLDSQKQ